MRRDTRGRVPFAMLGVLLLVSSLALVPTLSVQPAPESTDVERALEAGRARLQTAVREGATVAGERAAANPVIDPSDTEFGAALNDTTAFRDALRIRIYRQVRQRVTTVEATSGTVAATPTLPPIESPN